MIVVVRKERERILYVPFCCEGLNGKISTENWRKCEHIRVLVTKQTRQHEQRKRKLSDDDDIIVVV